jgi:hypothetical protein
MSNQPDPTLMQAEIDLQKAEEAIERATKERDEITAFIRRHKMYASISNGGRQHQKPATDETMVQALEAILSASEGPMFVPDVISVLKARGRKLTAVKPEAAVSSILSRSKQFKFQKGRGWTLQTP